MLSDYRGTPAWLATEVVNGDVSRFGGFSSELMFKFDVDSFGMVLVSIFTGDQILILDTKPDRVIDQISKLLNQEDIPSPMRTEQRKVALKLLPEDSRDRPLPSTTLLKIDSPTYAFWYLNY